MTDSQSVEADAGVGNDSRSSEDGKPVNGRKRHAVAVTPGLLPGVTATAADTGDRAAAQVLPARVTAAHYRPAPVRAGRARGTTVATGPSNASR
ncbi:hypothetical protein OHV13_34150 [Kitasatospora purpeofusca]|uniref:hypothetical protein n=1 Tax=Kitasatospora purpeofusca TaxID=67352 RepID=UPI0032562B9B